MLSKSNYCSFTLKVSFSRIAQIVTKKLGYFYRNYICKGLSKTAQSGHTALAKIGSSIAAFHFILSRVASKRGITFH